MGRNDKLKKNPSVEINPEILDFSNETWSYKGTVPNYPIQSDGFSYDIVDENGNEKNAVCLGILGMIIIVFNAKGPKIKEDDVLPIFRQIISKKNWHKVSEKEINTLSKAAINKLTDSETSGDVFDLASFAPIEIKRELLSKLFIIARYRIKSEFTKEAERRILEDIVPSIFANPELELALLTGLIVKPKEEQSKEVADVLSNPSDFSDKETESDENEEKVIHTTPGMMSEKSKGSYVPFSDMPKNFGESSIWQQEPESTESAAQMEEPVSVNPAAQTQTPVAAIPAVQPQESVSANVPEQIQAPATAIPTVQPQEPVSANPYQQPNPVPYMPTVQPQEPVSANVYTQNQTPAAAIPTVQPQEPVSANPYQQQNPVPYMPTVQPQESAPANLYQQQNPVPYMPTVQPQESAPASHYQQQPATPYSASNQTREPFIPTPPAPVFNNIPMPQMPPMQGQQQQQGQMNHPYQQNWQQGNMQQQAGQQMQPPYQNYGQWTPQQQSYGPPNVPAQGNPNYPVNRGMPQQPYQNYGQQQPNQQGFQQQPNNMPQQGWGGQQQMPPQYWNPQQMQNQKWPQNGAPMNPPDNKKNA